MSSDSGCSEHGRAPCKILSLQQILFFVSALFYGDRETVT